MATQRLEDRTCAAAKAAPGKRKELWDSHTRGLCLRVSPNKKTWVVRYRADGTQRRFIIGEYPRMELADARIEASRVLREASKSGADPAGDRLRNRAAAKAQPIKTFRQLSDAYLAACRAGQWKPKGKAQSGRTLKDVEESLNRYILPAFGDEKLAEVTRDVVKQFLRDMGARGIRAQTNKALAAIRQIFNYAIAEYEGRLVAVNVALGLPREEETPRMRVLTDAELKTLWVGLKAPEKLKITSPDDEPGSDGKSVNLTRRIAIALQLAMLLLQRRNEISGMMLSEVNLGEATWLIPGQRMKARKPHLVPLPEPAVDLVREAIELAKVVQPRGSDGSPPKDFPLFPSTRDPARPIMPNTVTHALGPVVKALKLDGVTVHDLRRTGSTAITSERLGFSHFIRSQVLAHTTDAGGGAAVSSRHYDANEYVAEKRRALMAWCNLLLVIVGDKKADANLHHLPGAAA